MSETIWRRDDNWVGSENEDSFVMVNIDTGAYVALNRTAFAVWQMLEAPATESEIASKLVERFDVSPAECKAAVLLPFTENAGSQACRRAPRLAWRGQLYARTLRQRK